LNSITSAVAPRLDDEADGRRPQPDLGEERRDGVGGARSLGRLRRHVELLLDDGRPDGGEANHEGNDLQMVRATKQIEGLGERHPLFLLDARNRVRLDALARDDGRDQESAQRHEDGTDEEQVHGAERRRVAGKCRARDAAERRAPADESEHTLGLARVVHDVRERPELADEQHAENAAREVERDRHPGGTRVPEEEPPEHEQQDRHAHLRDGQRPSPRQPPHEPRVAGHQDPDEEAGGQQDVWEVVGAEAGDELGSRERLYRVVGRHRQERV
jgi:hypothetical protein